MWRLCNVRATWVSLRITPFSAFHVLHARKVHERSRRPQNEWIRRPVTFDLRCRAIPSSRSRIAITAFSSASRSRSDASRASRAACGHKQSKKRGEGVSGVRGEGRLCAACGHKKKQSAGRPWCEEEGRLCAACNHKQAKARPARPNKQSAGRQWCVRGNGVCLCAGTNERCVVSPARHFQPVSVYVTKRRRTGQRTSRVRRRSRSASDARRIRITSGTLATTAAASPFGKWRLRRCSSYAAT